MNISPLNTQAFTIIELLIVIVVIGILATIVLNTVTGIQDRAQDTKLRTDLESVMKSLEAYIIDNGTYQVSGGGSGGNGQGWLNWSNGGVYPDSVTNVLISQGYNHGVEDVPIEETWDTYSGEELALMIYQCDAIKKVGVFAKLRAPTAEDNQTNTDWVNAGCTNYPCTIANRCYVVESTGTYETW